MKVFISWSGKRSKALAVALKEWIPLILQYAEPWVSDKDISAGERWAQAIAGQLESSNFGIICITPENLRSEWILFEAGALSKSMLNAKVIPLLFGLELSDLSGPLSQFQALKVDQQGLMAVIKAINAAGETKALESAINQLVPALWPQLQQKLNEIPDKEQSEKHMRPQTEILEELVTQVRGLGARLRDLDPEMIERDVRAWNPKYRDFDPVMFEEMVYFMTEPDDWDMNLLVLAGFLRDGLPWLSEVLIEARRDLKSASPKEAREIAHRLIRIVKQTTRGPLTERILGSSKSGHILMMGLPRLIDRMISQRVKFQPPKIEKGPSEIDGKT